MDKEIDSNEKSETWEVADLSTGAWPIGVKWVYKKKINAKGEMKHYKARLVVKGYKAEKN